MYQPVVPVMIASVGIRNSVRGVSRSSTALRAEISTVRRMGPSIKPMNRSMPVHNRPQKTWTKLSNQRWRLAIEKTMTASASAAYQR